jgi:pyruvyltransferase
MREIDMYWFRRPNGKPNFGDELGAEIVRRLGYTVRYVRPQNAELVACGSIMHHLTNPHTIVWGSGMMSPGKRAKVTPHNVFALRGTKTAELMDAKDAALGDPALLVPTLWEPAKAKKYKVGVVPHYVDKNHYRGADIIIDVEDPVDQVIEQITACDMIWSSSLHGYIIARAFGIPAERIAHPGVGGGSFKWEDFESVMGTPLEQTQNSLLHAFPL